MEGIMRKGVGKKTSIAVVGIVLCAALSGCVNIRIGTKDEEKTEPSTDPADKVADYVRDELKIDGAKIDPDSKEVKGEDGFTDTLWSVYDEKSDVTFYVSDNSYWPGEMLESSLTDDYDDSIFEKFMSSIKLDDLTYEITEKDGLKSANIVTEYKDRAGLSTVMDELEQVKEYFDNLGYKDLKIPYQIKYMNPLRTNIEDREIDDGDCRGLIYDYDEAELKSGYEEKYLLCALDYRFDDAIADFTDQEIKEIISDSNNVERLGIVKDGKTVMYEDLIANGVGYGVSFGSLYEVLKREGLDVSGTDQHYSFTGKNGHVYEISYDFNDLETEDYKDNDGKMIKGYYYIKDGEKTAMYAYKYNHFTADEIKEITGIEVVVGE